MSLTIIRIIFLISNQRLIFAHKIMLNNSIILKHNSVIIDESDIFFNVISSNIEITYFSFQSKKEIIIFNFFVEFHNRSISLVVAFTQHLNKLVFNENEHYVTKIANSFNDSILVQQLKTRTFIFEKKK